MVADGKRLLPRQAQKSGDDVSRLFAVTVGEGVLNGVVGDGYPAPGFVLLVAGSHLVEVGFADVVQKGDNGDALVTVGKPVNLLHARAGKNVAQAVVDIQAVLQQSALIRAVVAGRGGRGEKVGPGAEVVQELIRALPPDLFLIDRKKTFRVRHIQSSFRGFLFILSQPGRNVNRICKFSDKKPVRGGIGGAGCVII